MNTGQNFSLLTGRFLHRLDVLEMCRRYDWASTSNEIPIMKLDASFVQPWMKPLEEKFGQILPVVMRLPPLSCYSWHTDTNRFVCINTLLDVGKSVTAFRTSSGKNLFSIEEVPYFDGGCFLFNTQHPHEVYNLEPTYRHLVSFSFGRSAVYSGVRIFCASLNLLEPPARQTT